MPARRTTTLLTTGLLAVTLTGCGVGLDPQTYRERSTLDATNADVGGLALRDVAIAPPEGGASELPAGRDARLSLAVVSVSPQPDTLVSVTTPAAASVAFVDAHGQPVPAVTVPALGSLLPDGFGVVLRGLTRPLRPGMYVDMTFAFAKNGRATLKVPVRIYAEPVPRASYQPKHAGE